MLSIVLQPLLEVVSTEIMAQQSSLYISLFMFFSQSECRCMYRYVSVDPALLSHKRNVLKGLYSKCMTRLYCNV